MRWLSEITAKNVASISSKLFIFGILLICFSGAISALSTFLQITSSFFQAVGSLLSVTGILLLFLSWITPGILIVLGFPKLAHSWLRGINPIAVSSSSWEELSDGQKIAICVYGIALSALTLLFTVGFLLHNFRK
jgi:hypothetical protein